VELLAVVLVIAALMFMAIPRLSGGAMTRSSVRAAVRDLAAELRLARSRAVSEAVGNPQGYAVQMTGGPPYTGYQMVNLLTAAVVSTTALPAGVVCTGDAQFSFTPLGSLAVGSGTSLLLSAGGEQYSVTLTLATASVGIQKL
jgi:type II secretory pathway pseudopilin PulG